MTAEREIIRWVQNCEFVQEILSLTASDKSVKKGSRIYKLDPVLLRDGILVCRVRTPGLQAGDLPGSMILPKNTMFQPF